MGIEVISRRRKGQTDDCFPAAETIRVSSYGCSYQTADIEFGFTLSKARDKGDNLGHHLIQSFAPGEVSYEEAHRIGKAKTPPPR